MIGIGDGPKSDEATTTGTAPLTSGAMAKPSGELTSTIKTKSVICNERGKTNRIVLLATRPLTPLERSKSLKTSLIDGTGDISGPNTLP